MHSDLPCTTLPVASSAILDLLLVVWPLFLYAGTIIEIDQSANTQDQMMEKLYDYSITAKCMYVVVQTQIWVKIVLT